MFSGPFPHVGEDDLYSSPKPDLHLAIKTGPLVIFLLKDGIY